MRQRYALEYILDEAMRRLDEAASRLYDVMRE